MTHLTAIQSLDLPPMAWVATVDRESHIQLVHGSSVVIWPNAFAEGGWNGDFGDSEMRHATVLVGSGGWTDKRKAFFRSCSHTLERLWGTKSLSSVTVSNSLPLLLARTDCELLRTYPHYEADLLSFILGSSGMRRHIPLANRRSLFQFADSRLTISKNLELVFEVYSTAIDFHGFDHYFDVLSHTCRQIVGNLQAPARKRRYLPLATVSRGYDSPACAAIARQCGATDAVTFSDARSGYGLENDDGSEIASQLGLDAHTFMRKGYMQQDMVELPFLASGGGGEDVVLAGASDYLAGSVLFTGFLGDTVWGLETDVLRSTKGKIRYPGGGSIGEYRIRKDFVHLPVPIVFLRSHASIQMISKSSEMKPWCIGGNYDRPIPRRIAEDAGISRTAFGLSKMAITAPMYYDLKVSEILGPRSASEFGDFSKANFGALYSISSRARVQAYSIRNAIFERVAWRFPGIIAKLNLAEYMEVHLARRGRRSIGESYLLLQWSIEVLTLEYKAVLRRS